MGGDDPPHWIAVGGHSAWWPFPHTFALFLTILKQICLIYRILNERKTSHLHQDCHLYKNKEIYIILHVLNAVCSTFRPTTRTYCTKTMLVHHHLAICGSWGLKIFVWGVLWGVMALWGGDNPRVGGELATMQTWIIALHHSICIYNSCAASVLSFVQIISMKKKNFLQRTVNLAKFIQNEWSISLYAHLELLCNITVKFPHEFSCNIVLGVELETSY